MLTNIFSVALLLSSASASCLHGTSLMPRRLNKRAAGEVEVSNFGYTGLTGPLNWHNIEADNELCNTGSNQSPINIDDTVALATEAPSIDIANVEAAEFENLGTTLETIVNGTTTLGGQDFSLAQFHLHTPSEHRIGDEYFPLEMHMVHEAADDSGKIVVLAVLFQLSDDGTTGTDLLSAATAHIDDVVEPGTVTETAALDFAPLVEHLTTTPLLNYTGSLTTPPCSEDVTFFVTQQPMPLDVATYNKVKRVIKFNSRFTQNSLGQANLLDQGTLANIAAAEEPAAEEAVAEEAVAEDDAAAEEPAAEETAMAEHETSKSSAAATNSTAEAAAGEGEEQKVASNAEQLYALSAMLQEVDSAIHEIIG
ncbi:hypothetical protein BFW01_g5617 [Lasiodiplodia theobromae]|nr:hypothetical protein BFW01_g5617 [Lasiodiplodia theobromae]